jgi:predicted GIY-YIG superfamily endonuclease
LPLPALIDDDETPRGLYRAYVISLSADAMATRKFADKNPAYRPGQPCYFVDVTGLAPDLRFDQHMAGIKDNAFVRMHGVALRPDFTVDFAPSAFPVAVEQEAAIARSLRGEGCGVWAPVLDAPETFSVYVIRLDEAVARDRRFRAANPIAFPPSRASSSSRSSRSSRPSRQLGTSPRHQPDLVTSSTSSRSSRPLCLYVGATGLAPEERFANHKAGHKANWYAEKYGDELLPDLFAHLNPMTHQRAMATEIALAEELREEGIGVWQN